MDGNGDGLGALVIRGNLGRNRLVKPMGVVTRERQRIEGVRDLTNVKIQIAKVSLIRQSKGLH